MKGFLRTSAILLLCTAFLASAQKKERKEQDDDDDSSSKSVSRYPGRELGGSGRCSCRAQREEIETLELRLDRMIETWNDFVDKNRGGSSNDGPIRRPPGSGGFGSRPPPYGHGPGQSPGRSDRPRYPFNRGMEDDERAGGGRNTPPRRFQF